MVGTSNLGSWNGHWKWGKTPNFVCLPEAMIYYRTGIPLSDGPPFALRSLGFHRPSAGPPLRQIPSAFLTQDSGGFLRDSRMISND